MPRPRKFRYVRGKPIVDLFLPNRLPSWESTEVILPVEGLEAIRLNDLKGLGQEEAAKRMNISRQTFGRILIEARGIIAEALVMGKALRIEGGHFEIPPGVRIRRRQGGDNAYEGKEVLNMPRFDGTGPQGAGPMTGRGRGMCNPAGIPNGGISGRGISSGYGQGQGQGPGRGMGQSRGSGRGISRFSSFSRRGRRR
ncbi:MAG: DUF134 domain-containing protein [Deltaproteobacteria bacterium]|nr:DUF134 domain-containing protein [Deltaproteobacteria bacterium]